MKKIMIIFGEINFNVTEHDIAVINRIDDIYFIDTNIAEDFAEDLINKDTYSSYVIPQLFEYPIFILPENSTEDILKFTENLYINEHGKI